MHDITGERFGRLVALKRDADYITPSGGIEEQWLCQCDCGNQTVVRKYCLKRGSTKSCGCLAKELTSKCHFVDLTGKRFGKLVVIERVDDYISPKGWKATKWLCRCDCGREVFETTKNLNRKDGVRCCHYCVGKRISAAKKKYNDYEIQEDYVIMYTSKGEPFYVDLEDFWKVKNICWSITKEGYVAGKVEDKTVRLHRFIMDAPNNKKVDHRGGDKTRNDNRKYNLRLASDQENAMNRKTPTNNTSGVSGVFMCNRCKKWCAQIGYKGHRKHLGYFDNFEEAVKARKEAEQQLFGEWSYSNSQKRKEITNEDN